MNSIQGYTVTQAEVVYGLPGLNFYVVRLCEDVTMGLLYIACGPSGGGGLYGVSGDDFYMPFTRVNVLVKKSASKIEDNPISVPNPSLLIIIGRSVQRKPVGDVSRLPNRSLFDTKIDLENDPVREIWDALSKLSNNSTAAQRYSASEATDSLPGEFCKMAGTGSHLTVSPGGVKIGASHMAGLEAFAFEHKLRLLSYIFEHISTNYNEFRNFQGPYTDFYKGLALTENEGLGGINEPSIKMEEGELEGDFDTLEGVMRYEERFGIIPGGFARYVTLPEDLPQRTSESIKETPPLGLFKERIGFDGTYKLESAGGIKLCRSLYIPVPRRVKETDEDEGIPEEFEVKPWVQDQTEEYRDYAELEASHPNESREADANIDSPVVSAKPDYYQTQTQEQVQDRYGLQNLADAVRKLEALKEWDLDYRDKELPVAKIIEPLTKLEKTLSVLESIINIGDDGSIILSSGRGSEIKMTEGRIELSAPGGIHVRSGKEFFVMAGDRAVINAGEDINIQSSKASVRVKADSDLMFTGGNSGKGLTLLENRAKEDKDDSDGLSSGIMLKAVKDIGLNGENILGSLHKQGEKAPDGSDLTTGGAIVMDAGEGIVGSFGKTLYSTATLSCTITGGDSGVNLSGKAAGIYADNCNITGDTLISKPNPSSVPKVLYKGNRFVEDTISLSGSDPGLSIGGQLKVAKNAVVAQSLSAGRMLAGSGNFGNGSSTSGLSGGRSPGKVDTGEISTSAAKDASGTVKSALGSSERVFNRDKFKKTYFYYKRTNDMLSAMAFKIKQSRWQRMLESEEVWTETPVLDFEGSATYIYPGEQHWKGELFEEGYTPLNEYKIHHKITGDV